MSGSPGKAREVVDEFRSVVLGRGPILDAALPPLVYLGIQALADPGAAALAALLVGGGLTILRLRLRRSTAYALIGLGGSLVAFLASLWLQRAEVFFLPEILISAGLAAVCFISIAARRPMVAWTSHLVRGWRRDWYWHPRVRPAYTETTLAWGAFFLLQALVQWRLLQGGQVAALALASLLTGWPATVVLLVLTYLYGSWRLSRLSGPSVAEFSDGRPPPWSGQRRGF